MSVVQPDVKTHVDRFGFQTFSIGNIVFWDAKNEERYESLKRQISYVRDPFTGNFIVSLLGTSQRIVVLPGRFFAVFPDVDRRATLGSREASCFEIEALGFIVDWRADDGGDDIPDIDSMTTVEAIRWYLRELLDLTKTRPSTEERAARVKRLLAFKKALDKRVEAERMALIKS